MNRENVYATLIYICNGCVGICTLAKNGVFFQRYNIPLSIFMLTSHVGFNDYMSHWKIFYTIYQRYLLIFHNFIYTYSSNRILFIYHHYAPPIVTLHVPIHLSQLSILNYQIKMKTHNRLYSLQVHIKHTGSINHRIILFFLAHWSSHILIAFIR